MRMHKKYLIGISDGDRGNSNYSVAKYDSWISDKYILLPI